MEIERKYIHDLSDEYKERLAKVEDVCRYIEKFSAIHFDPENILRKNNIGLWTLRVNRDEGRYELHVNDTMEQALGLSEKLSPEECYSYCISRIHGENAALAMDVIEKMISNKNQAVEFECVWDHPVKGTVCTRSSGIYTGDVGGIAVIEGYHRILN